MMICVRIVKKLSLICIFFFVVGVIVSCGSFVFEWFEVVEMFCKMIKDLILNIYRWIYWYW